MRNATRNKVIILVARVKADKEVSPDEVATWDRDKAAEAVNKSSKELHLIAAANKARDNKVRVRRVNKDSKVNKVRKARKVEFPQTGILLPQGKMKVRRIWTATRVVANCCDNHQGWPENPASFF